MAAEYQYKPLQPPVVQPDLEMIRLIEILPGSEWRDPVLRCNLEHFPLKKAPGYMALSYSWGDPNTRHPIWCSGAPLDVTTNLYAALIHIRDTYTTPCLNDSGQEHENTRCTCCIMDEHRPRWLWADAVSIDQKSVEEKNVQVPLMRQIYSGARKTFIWLGFDVNWQGMALIPRLAHASEKYKAKNDKRVIFQMDLKALKFYDIPPPRDRAYKEFASLLDSAWFRRAWIIQEVAVSKNSLVTSSSWTTKWTDLLPAVGFAAQIGAFPLWNNPELMQQVVRIEIARRSISESTQHSLLELLLLHRRSQASNLRDKIYALCGLAADTGPEELNVVPDYRAEVADVYKNVAVSIMLTYRTLDILSAPHPPRGSDVGALPSWVPDWSISDGTCALRGGPVPPGSTLFSDFAATPADVPPSINFSDDGDLLGIVGHTVDTITEIGKANIQNVEDKMSWLQRTQRIPFEQEVFNDWERIFRCRSETKYITGETILDAYWQTISLGYMPDGYDRAKEDFLQWDQSTRSIARHLPLTQLKPLFPVLALPMFLSTSISVLRRGFQVDKTMAFRYRLTSAEKRRLFRTQSGYMGLVPRLAQIGDRIGLFKGGAVPLVIREEGSRWRLIGDCYVHGMMKGEAFRDEECKTMWFV